MHDLPDEIERLEKRMEGLERRVHAAGAPARSALAESLTGTGSWSCSNS